MIQQIILVSWGYTFKNVYLKLHHTYSRYQAECRKYECAVNGSEYNSTINSKKKQLQKETKPRFSSKSVKFPDKSDNSCLKSHPQPQKQLKSQKWQKKIPINRKIRDISNTLGFAVQIRWHTKQIQKEEKKYQTFLWVIRGVGFPYWQMSSKQQRPIIKASTDDDDEGNASWGWGDEWGERAHT